MEESVTVRARELNHDQAGGRAGEHLPALVQTSRLVNADTRCGRIAPQRGGPSSVAFAGDPLRGAHPQYLSTSDFIKDSPSVANWRSLWYIRRQILVAGTSFSSARPKASMTMVPL